MLRQAASDLIAASRVDVVRSCCADDGDDDVDIGGVAAATTRCLL